MTNFFLSHNNNKKRVSAPRCGQNSHAPFVLRNFIASTLFVALGGVTYGQELETKKLDLLFDRLQQNNKAMGSLLMNKNGKDVYSRTIGYAHINGTEKKLLTASTKYRVGSVTKMFTAVMIFQFIDEKKLKLSEHLDKFFPQIPGAEKITIEHILGHRSGIHEVTENGDFRNRRFEHLAKDEMVAIISKAKLDFEPGTRYTYSSSGYYLLALIVERLAGKLYEEALHERIIAKVGLTNSYHGTEKINAGKNESFSYRFGRNWEQQPETNISILFGSGALISTTADMATFIRSLFEGKLLTKQNLTAMMHDKLGMDTFTYNGKRAYGHTGGIDGFGSWLVYIPEEKLVVSYATNGKVYPVTNIMDGVFSIYFNQPYTVPDFQTAAIDTALLDTYVGVYASSEASIKFTITREGQKLFVQLPNGAVVVLEPTDTDKFRIEAAPVVFHFLPAKEQLIVTRGGRDRVLTKENSSGPDPVLA